MEITKYKMKSLMLGISLSCSAFLFPAMSQSYVVLAKDVKVFDEPNPTYVTLNQKNKEVAPVAGMAFKKIEDKAGWSMVEYSPGLRGYISDLVKAGKCSKPKVGTYTVKNKGNEKLAATFDGTSWTATVGAKNYSGKDFNNIVVFFDAKNNPAYSLVDFGSGPIVMCYDNSVTNFF